MKGSFLLIITSLLFAAGVPRAERVARRNARSRAVKSDEVAKALFEATPPSDETDTASIKTTKVVRSRGLGATTTTTATATSITSTTTMMEDGDMSPSEFYSLHHREHGLAVAKEVAAAEAEAEVSFYEEEERELRQQRRRRRRRRRRREPLEIVERERERPHRDGQQQQEQQQEQLPEEVGEFKKADKKEQVEQKPIGGAVEAVEGSASPTADGDSDGVGYGDSSPSPWPLPPSSLIPWPRPPTRPPVRDVYGDSSPSPWPLPPSSLIPWPRPPTRPPVRDGYGDSSPSPRPLPPSFNPESSAGDGISDVPIDITEDCNVNPKGLGDGSCTSDEPYNTFECGWDGGDCCWQTCRDGTDYWGLVERCGDGDKGYGCLDPRFSPLNITYDEEGEPDLQRTRERRALRALYRSTNGDAWECNGSAPTPRQWLDKTGDHCYWDPSRIRCTGGEGYVRGIHLGSCNLNGTLPTEIGDLVHLEELNLNYNELFGTIPSSMGNLTKLSSLSVRGASLKGPVIANVMRLIFGTPGVYYHHGWPDYAGLSPDNCTNVVGWADADGNGCDSYENDSSSCTTDDTRQRNVGLPADRACCACGLYSRYDRERELLEELYRATNGGGWHDSHSWTNKGMKHCDWTGVRCNDDGMVSNITLSSKNLRGSLPTSIGQLVSLGVLDLSNNVITGGIVTEVGALTKLEVLHLNNNALGRTVPTQITSLSLLRRLDLSHNELNGPIPVGIADLSLVEDLRLSHNQFTGTIPPEFRRMSRLKLLDLDNNWLTGSIPVEIGLLSLLRELRISSQENWGNCVDGRSTLSGPIPVELGDCQYLEVVDLSGNELTGSLPTELARLARVKSLLLHGNLFEGYIPSEYGLLPSLENITLKKNFDDWLSPCPQSLVGTLPFEGKLNPAPLSLCFNEAFDLHSDRSWCPPERNALKRLYDATGGDRWSNSANWTDPYVDHCSWYGVGCTVCHDVLDWTDYWGEGCYWYQTDPHRCRLLGDERRNNNHTAKTACCVCQRHNVTSLSLNSNGLSGSLPTELGQLSHLERLNLANNELVGGLPSDIVHLTKLHLLNLTHNALAGGFPAEIANLPSLNEVFLSNNDLRGGLSIRSSTSASNLTLLHLANNKFGGEISAAIGQFRNFPSLQEIDFSYNTFHGSMTSVPLRGITKLAVGGNERMAAPIPSSFCHDRTLDLDLQDSPVHCPVLSFLRLFHNSINGTGWNWEDVEGVCDESSWNGIKCDDTNTSIVEINLANHDLSGTLPDSFGEHMAALSLLRVLDLNHNGLHGPIPVDLARLSLLEEVRLANNSFSGTLPAQISNLPRLLVLDLTANRLTGTLPMEYGRLSSLRKLRLARNRFVVKIDMSTGNITSRGLRGEIPFEWGNLANMEQLDLSGNLLAGSIPTSIGSLGQLAKLLLNNNSLGGFIPSTLGRLTQVQYLALRDNYKLEKLAPLSVCALANKFDLQSEDTYCPQERDVLKKLYSATNGESWADARNWLDEYDHPCNSTKKWFGISCNTELKVHSINLTGNGLYGTLGSEILQLVDLQELKVGDNRLYGTLPTTLDRHTKLEVLQLSGNDFSGEIPASIVNLTSLSTLRLHANKFTKGVLSTITVPDVIADCGDPYYHGKLDCENCNITCCNSEGKCMENDKEKLNLPEQTGLFLGCMIACLLFLCATVFTLNRCADLPMPKLGAVDYCGTGSVYSFFLTKSCRAWILAFATIAAQVGIFTLFLSGANIDNENSDWEYYMRCPPNQLWCESDHTVDYKGWLIFGLLMVAFLGKDVVSGVMLVYAAGLRTNFFCFVSGIFISVVTGYAVWTSVQYNLAIATSNTALVSNAVIILFVNDIDERMFQFSGWLFPEWVATLTRGSNERSAEICSEDSISKEHSGNNAKNDSEVTQKLLEQSAEVSAEGSIIDEHSGNRATTAHVASNASVLENQETATSELCLEALCALFAKQSEIEKLRSDMKELKDMLSKDSESTSTDANCT